MKALISGDTDWILAETRRLLKARRVALHMSQQELADRMGSTQSHICDLEKGRNENDFATLARWAAALGLQARISLTEDDR